MNASAQKFSGSQPSITDDVGRSILVSPLSLDHFLRKEIYATVDQDTNPNNFLRVIDEAHCRAPAELFRNYNYDYAHGMMIVYFLSGVKLEGATNATAVHTVDDMKFLKDHFRMVVVDCRHLCRSVKVLQDENGV